MVFEASITDWISAIASGLTLILAVVALVLANDWRRQYLAGKKVDASEQVYLRSHEFIDQMEQLTRTPSDPGDPILLAESLHHRLEDIRKAAREFDPTVRLAHLYLDENKQRTVEAIRWLASETRQAHINMINNLAREGNGTWGGDAGPLTELCYKRREELNQEFRTADRYTPLIRPR